VLDLVAKEGQITVTDLVKTLSISAVTVRSDLDALASIGAVVRSHGEPCDGLRHQDYPLRTKESARMRKNQNWAGRCGTGAAGETIILDSGTPQLR